MTLQNNHNSKHEQQQKKQHTTTTNKPSRRTTPSWLLFLLTLLLALLAYTLHTLSLPPPSLKPKIFILGLSKTGTTSLGDALETLGYRRLGWRDIRSRHMCYTWAHGDLTSLLSQTQYYDAFEDLPWPKVYREMAALYPDAKFVLSRRKDEETWLRSMRVHVGRGEWLPYEWFYGATTVPGNEETILKAYRNHTREVREFFESMPERLVEVNIDEGDGNWEVLCRVAQCPDGAKKGRFPRANTAASWNTNWLLHWLVWCWGWTVTRSEEQAAKLYYERDNKAIKALLEGLWTGYDFVEKVYSEMFFRVQAVVSPPLIDG